jgi:hypothetical protein
MGDENWDLRQLQKYYDNLAEGIGPHTFEQTVKQRALELNEGEGPARRAELERRRFMHNVIEHVRLTFV